MTVVSLLTIYPFTGRSAPGAPGKRILGSRAMCEGGQPTVCWQETLARDLDFHWILSIDVGHQADQGPWALKALTPTCCLGIVFSFGGL